MCVIQSVDLPYDNLRLLRDLSLLYLGDYKERGHMLPLNGIDENTSHGTTRAIGSVNVQVHIAAGTNSD